MSNTDTTVMQLAYEQEAAPTMFISGMFQSPASNFHNSEGVEYDIVRGDEEISVVVQDLSVGARENSNDTYTNKRIIPPIHKEKGPINAHNLIKRVAGSNPFESVDFQANAIKQGVMLGKKLQRKIQRSIELQSIQVLTLGVVTLVDNNGTPVYTVNWSPKATHFPTTGTIWSAGASTKIADLNSLANVVRSDGLSNPDTLIMGEASFEQFIQDATVKDRLDNRRIEGNSIVPMDRRGNGGIYRGTVEVGNYKFDLWTYPGRYKHPQTGLSTQFLPDGKVVMTSSSARLDATFGGVPRIGSRDPRIPASLTSRVMVPGQMMDIQMNAWISLDGETMNVQASTRPLMIPTAIDTFGCLDTLL
jgi:Phage major capsid protein E